MSFSSSCSVYGNVKGSVSEKSLIQNYYAFTKYKSEEILKNIQKFITISTEF